MKTNYLVIALSFLLCLNSNAQIFIGETEVDTTTIISGLDIPWEIIYGPDNHIWFTERYGVVSRMDPQSGVRSVILDITDKVWQSGETGLLGMVLHPDFGNYPYVYLAYTYKPAAVVFERIVRYEYSQGELINEQFLMNGIPGWGTHVGCRLIIDNNYKLIFTTGDAQNQPAAQNINELTGKTIRINLDGSIPGDNPWPDNPVWSYGHRNAQGLWLGPNGILYSSEHGASTDDELNIIEKGRNYGWPNVEGFCDLPEEITFCNNNNVLEPLVAWTPTVAASDIIYYTHPAIPEWQDHILMTTLKNKRIYDLELSNDGLSIVNENEYFEDWWGRLRDICVGPDGSVYLATNGPDWGNSEPFTHSIVKVFNPDYVSVINSYCKKDDLLFVAPNPVTEIIHLRIDKGLSVDAIKLFDLSGRLVKEVKFTDYNMSIKVDNLQNGFYTLSIFHNEKAIISKKISVNN